MLEKKPYLKDDLFIRGFLISDDLSLKEKEELFPFYGNWNSSVFGSYLFLTHSKTTTCFYESGGSVFFIMGHAYNPFTMKHKESDILADIAKAYGRSDYYERINELSGVFVYGVINEDKIEFLTDASGMQSASCGVVADKFYLASHPQLIGDVCSLEMSDFARELVNYKWYRRILGSYLPADMTPFECVKRVVSNHSYCFKDGKISHFRFWPLKDTGFAEAEDDYSSVIKAGADIVKNNMILIAKKWDNPALSLSGGIDSNTTFAAVKGSYDKYKAFSFISAEKEIRDAEAAKIIAGSFNVPFTVYNIPDNNDELEDFEEIREILRHNSGYIGERYSNEVRKRIYLRRNCDCEVEVKSWASETIRAYWYKYFSKTKMPPLSAKLFRNLYKIFTVNRALAHRIDRLFDEFIEEYEFRKIPDMYSPADMHYNEVGWGSWGSMNISDMKYSHEMTVPYNNRIFYDHLLRVPLEKRIKDEHHLDMKKYLNKELYDMNIRVVNMKETKFRAKSLGFIFTVNTYLPF